VKKIKTILMSSPIRLGKIVDEREAFLPSAETLEVNTVTRLGSIHALNDMTDEDVESV
jgi:hypothetical protein